MKDRINIQAETRSVTGKKVKQLRRDGLIPAVIYGQRDPLHVQIENRPLRRALRTAGTTQLVDVELDGRTITVLTREIQQHLTRGDLIHVDFMEVDMKSTITSEAALVAIGLAQPEEDGLGVVTMPVQSVDIECLPEDLISEIEVDTSRIETPDHVLYVSDLDVPKGVTILTDPELVIARFEYIQEEEEEEEEVLEEELYAPSADSVEVIKKGKEDEEDEF